MTEFLLSPGSADAVPVRIPPHPVDTSEATGRPAVASEAEAAALKMQLRQLNLVMDSALDYAIITLDMAGDITRWSAGASRITGYLAAEVLGRGGDVIFTSEDRAEDRLAVELCRAIADGRAVNERWHLRRDGSRFWASGLMMPLLGAEGRPEGFLNILRDQTEARAQDERRDLLMAEMDHRIKNMFATVLAVATQTQRYTDSVEDFQTAFAARLGVLSRSHEVLIRGDWVDAPLCEVIKGAVQAYQGDPAPVTLQGPAVMLAAPIVVTMSLVFHELATNAAKYGALSVATGCVDVAWTVIPGRPGARHVEIAWRERGGPPVRQPSRSGFGSQLLKYGMPAGGTVAADYRPAGLECRIVLPLGSDVRP